VIVPPGSYQVRTDTGSGDATVTGVTNDPSSRNVLDVHTGSGDVSVVAAA
jgi:ribosomal protein L11 methylase PrmA